MKKVNVLLSVFLVASMLLSGCGSSEKKSETRKMDEKLDSLITNLAACKEQNTNCEAYTKASEGISAMAQDTSNKNLVDDLFNGIAQSSTGSRSAACAHALNFWVKTGEFYQYASYGRIVLEALKKEKYDENSYNGSTLGQFLSGWLVSSDESLLKDIHAVIKDKNTEKRGRKELIRLSSANSFKKAGQLDLLVAIAKDTTESEEIRVACLSVLWRAEEITQYQKIESLYMDFLKNASPAIVGGSLDGLSYMKSVKAYDMVLETISKYGANELYCSSASRSLTNYISFLKININAKKAFDLAVKMATNKSMKPYNRSYYLFPIEAFGGELAKNTLVKLSSESEREISEPAKNALKRLKEKS